MTKHIYNQSVHEHYEYHGNTTVACIIKRAGIVVRRDWIIFDTVEEAQEFFNNDCE